MESEDSLGRNSISFPGLTSAGSKGKVPGSTIEITAERSRSERRVFTAKELRFSP
jgi:hypothetical protein